MKRILLLLFAFICSVTFMLTACSNKSSSDGGEDKGKDDDKRQEEKAGDGPKGGGTLVYALDSEPSGLFNWAFYGEVPEAEVIEFFDDNLIDYDDNIKPIPNVASWETEDNQHYTFKFKEGVKWHNGEELTVHDWVFAIETIAHPDYDGPRYTNVMTIEGVEDFKEGKADEISGLKVVNDYEIEITFDKARVNNLENLWTYPMSRKEFEGIEVKDMPESDQVRVNPVGIGPYKITKIIPGESIQLQAFEDYWQGKPHIDNIIIKVIDPSLVVGELKNNQLDMTSFHPSNHSEVEALDNTEILRAPGISYYYIGFRLGSYDGEKAKMDFEKYHSKELRTAMAHAIDREAWIDEFFFGLGTPVNRPVPNAHWIAADDADLENHFEYDPELAKKILDEAGYVEGDDGWRVDPDGNEFVIKFSHYATQNPTFEARAKAITQYWEDIGLKTELEMVDSTLYYEMLEEADPKMEVFFGGWSTGADPDPTGLWGSHEKWNFPRWVNEKNDKYLEDALNVDIVGTSQDKRKELYVKWQQNINEHVPMIPITELDELLAINNRVKGVTLNSLGKNSPHEWWVEE